MSSHNDIYHLFFKLIFFEYTLITFAVTFTSTVSLNLSKSNNIEHDKIRNLNDSKINEKINFNNHIHIAMGFDDKYALISSVSIASILYTANIDTYLHIHIITFNNFSIETI